MILTTCSWRPAMTLAFGYFPWCGTSETYIDAISAMDAVVIIVKNHVPI
jgi:hypothetical protein